MRNPLLDMADRNWRRWLRDGTVFAAMAHPYRAMMIIVASMCTIATFFTDGPYSAPQIIATLIYMGLLACMYWHPVPCSYAIIIISVTTSVIPDIEFIVQPWNLWLAAGLLGYGRHLRIAVSLIVAQTAIMAVGVGEGIQATTWNFPGVLTSNLSCLIVTIIGYALTEHQTAESLRHEAQENEQRHLHRDMMLASRIHDSATRGLALISLLAEQCAQKDIDGGSAEKIRLIGSTARSTLCDVRTVIDILNREETVSPSEEHGIGRSTHSGQSMGHILRHLLDDNDARMSAIGIHGESVVESSLKIKASAIAPELLQEITDLIGQIYTNVAIHGVHGMDAYHVRIELTDTTLYIRESNIIGHADDHLHLGRGLSMHARRIKRLGGDIVMNSEDGVWVLYTFLPLQH